MHLRGCMAIRHPYWWAYNCLSCFQDGGPRAARRFWCLCEIWFCIERHGRVAGDLIVVCCVVCGLSQTLASRACAHLSVVILANALIEAQHAFVRVLHYADSHLSACTAGPVTLVLPRFLEAISAAATDETIVLQIHTWGGAAGEFDLEVKLKPTGPHRRSLTNPRVRTCGLLRS